VRKVWATQKYMVMRKNWSACSNVSINSLTNTSPSAATHIPERVRDLLLGLGLAESELTKPLSVLSGGQKKLVGLARLLLVHPDVLLLDEPDNHLDLPGKVYLEKLIREYDGTVVIVSHDRYLLDAVVTHIAELEDGKMTVFEGDYSSYIADKEMRLRGRRSCFVPSSTRSRAWKAAIKRFAIWGKVYDNEKFAIKARSMQKRLDKMDRVEKPITERRRMDLGNSTAGAARTRCWNWRISQNRLAKSCILESQRDHLARRARWADRCERRREVCVAADDAGAGNA
jgi:ATPase subunit of ABC transporter with duplicated ATPase domains